MVRDEHCSFRAVKKKLGVAALLPMLCRLCFTKSFQSDNHVNCKLKTLFGFIEMVFKL